MAKMYDSGQEETSHRGNDHPGLQKSYHMNLADQMDAQSNGFPWPSFMTTGRGAAITAAVVLLMLVLMTWLLGGF